MTKGGFSSFGKVKVQVDLVFSEVEEVRMAGRRIHGCRTAAIGFEDGEQSGESYSMAAAAKSRTQMGI
jgi:hypothetical protein